ncbi:9970_t:CDS:1, partial [Dentiscutata erythropus]
YSYIMECHDIKPRYKILKELLDKYKTSSKRIYQIWRGEEANRVTWDQPIPQSYKINNIYSYEVPGFSNNSSNINSYKASLSTNVNHSEVLPDKSAEMGRPKIQSSTSSRAVKKSTSPTDNTLRRKNDLEKLMKNTKRLAPILLSLS